MKKYQQISANTTAQLMELRKCIEQGKTLLDNAMERQRQIAKLSGEASLAQARIERQMDE